MSEPRCPSCGSFTLSVERRPDGGAICAMCGWSGKYAMCFNDQKTEVRISSGPRQWILKADGLILSVAGGPNTSLEEAERGIPVIEAEPVRERIKQLETQLKEANKMAADVESKILSYLKDIVGDGNCECGADDEQGFSVTCFLHEALVRLNQLKKVNHE